MPLQQKQLSQALELNTSCLSLMKSGGKCKK